MRSINKEHKIQIYFFSDNDVTVNKMFRSSYKLTEYSEDILSWIRIREVQMYQVQLQSPQLDKRRQLVEWTGSVAAQLKLSTQTVHLAIRYMDVFMAGHNIGIAMLFN